MARTPRRPATARPQPPDGKSERDGIVEALMALLDEQPIEQIGFAEIAARAGVSLAELRNMFGAKLAIIAAYTKDIDRQVLGGIDADMAEEPPRERLFDVLMRRLEALAPHKAAIRSLLRSARRNPPPALALNAMAVRSQQWMLTAADMDAAGTRGMLRAQGLALLYASVLRTWVDDDDPGQARTMAALDRELARGARCGALLNDVWGVASVLARLRPGRRWRRRDREEPRPP